MTFKVDESVRELFPDTKIGILLFNNIDNTKLHALEPLLREKEEDIRKHLTLKDLDSNPKITDWREAYRLFGCKPSQYKCSIEALLRRVLQGKEIPSINPIVDAYNIISLEFLLPIGASDVDCIDGNVTLTIADGSEEFIMLGKKQPETIRAGEVIYKDEVEVLCRAWNYRECEKTKITEHTKFVIFFIEGLTHTSREEIEEAIEILERVLTPFSKGGSHRILLPRIED